MKQPQGAPGSPAGAIEDLKLREGYAAVFTSVRSKQIPLPLAQGLGYWSHEGCLGESSEEGEKGVEGNVQR